jgi:hypothetical protein
MAESTVDKLWCEHARALLGIAGPKTLAGDSAHGYLATDKGGAPAPPTRLDGDGAKASRTGSEATIPSGIPPAATTTQRVAQAAKDRLASFQPTIADILSTPGAAADRVTELSKQLSAPTDSLDVAAVQAKLDELARLIRDQQDCSDRSAQLREQALVIDTQTAYADYLALRDTEPSAALIEAALQRAERSHTAWQEREGGRGTRSQAARMELMGRKLEFERVALNRAQELVQELQTLKHSLDVEAAPHQRLQIMQTMHDILTSRSA